MNIRQYNTWLEDHLAEAHLCWQVYRLVDRVLTTQPCQYLCRFEPITPGIVAISATHATCFDADAQTKAGNCMLQAALGLLVIVAILCPIFAVAHKRPRRKKG